MAEKANHHYIPQFYLRNFASGSKRQAKIFVYDESTKRAFTTQVRNVGSRRHFNRIEAENMHANAVEDALAQFEGELSSAFAEVIEAKKFPSNEHFSYIMNFLALVAVRNPRYRSTMEDFHERSVKAIMSAALSSKEAWDSQIRQMRKAGEPLKNEIPYEEMKSFHTKDQYSVQIDQTRLIQIEFKAVDKVLEWLPRRNWCLATASNGHSYICSDAPVVLSWVDESDKGFRGPGFGLKQTIVLFPIGPQLLLIGTFEDLPKKTRAFP
ncbi:MAG: DUF4238 domain-containing protein [Pseudomonadota bacterium]